MACSRIQHPVAPDLCNVVHMYTFFSVTPSHVAGPDCVVDQVSGASVNLSPCAHLLVMAVRLRVVRVDTFLAVSLFTSHLRSCAPTKLQCLEVSLLHRGLRNFCLLHHMPYSGTGTGSGSSEHAGTGLHALTTPSPRLSLSPSLCAAQSRRLIKWWLYYNVIQTL